MRGHCSSLVRVYGAAESGGDIIRAEKGAFWAEAELVRGKSIFASFGLAAAQFKFTGRRADVAPGDTLGCGGLDFFVTETKTAALSWREILAARVTISACRRGEMNFFGVMTEKYAANNDEEAYRTDERTVILVTPKLVSLRDGDEVLIDNKAVYIVRLTHDLDPYKNEYELWNRKDV